MAERVNVGVVGCGVVATAYYLPYLMRMESARLVAVCDRDAERAEACKRLFGAAEVYRDYDEMIDRADVDAVLILTAPGTHARFALRAVEARKHILIQKPMALNMDDARAIADAVRKAGVKCVVEPSSNSPLEPGYREIREAIKQGAIGQPYAFFWIAAVPDRYSRWLGGNPYGAGAFYAKDSGGFLFDYPYAPNQVVATLGACASVMARGTIAKEDRWIVPDSEYTEFLKSVTDPQHANYWDVVFEKPRTQYVRQEAEDHFFSLYEMANGAVGVVWVGRAFHPVPPGMRLGGFQVLGTEGTLVFGYGPNRASVISTKKELFPQVDADGWYHWPRSRTTGKTEWPKPPPGAFNYYHASTQHLVDCILEDREPVVGLDWGLHVTEMLVGSRISSDQGIRYKMTTTLDW